MADNEDPLSFGDEMPAALSDEVPVPGRRSFKDDDALLTPAEIKKAKEEARAKVLKEEKAFEYKRIMQVEEDRLKREKGKKTGKVDKDERVTLMVELPLAAPYLSVNGEQFHHGQTYDLPRHQAEYLREMMQRANQHQAILEGKDLMEQFRVAKNPTLSPSLVN